MTSDFMIIGNLKMHAVGELLVEYAKVKDKHFGLLVPHPYLVGARKLFADSGIWIGAQSMSAWESGAHTGCVSGEMLKELGIGTVMIGHSEVRAMGEGVAEQLQIANHLGMNVIYCVGEDLLSYEKNTRDELLQRQLSVLPPIANLVVAYEPVWSIGTGKIPSYQDINDAVSFIKQWLSVNMTGNSGGSKVLYGGSINNRNCEEVRSQTDVDGFLIGGAALDPETMLEVIERCK